MQKINDITALCRLFGLPFESFVFDDWAVIHYDFLNDSQSLTGGHCEVSENPFLTSYILLKPFWTDH